jgi:hypothetical protein
MMHFLVSSAISNYTVIARKDWHFAGIFGYFRRHNMAT